jgi:hypothetical protein
MITWKVLLKLLMVCQNTLFSLSKTIMVLTFLTMDQKEEDMLDTSQLSIYFLGSR